MINKKFNFSTRVVADSHNKSRERAGKNAKPLYVLDFPGSDYEKFIQIVGPYIHKSMQHRVPEPRTLNSVYGTGDKAFLDKYLGKAFSDPNFAYIYKRNK